MLKASANASARAVRRMLTASGVRAM